jgi:hypothetical protein
MIMIIKKKNPCLFKDMKLNTRKTPIYGNCRILSPEGQLLCLCLPKKINWYLERNLGEIVEEDPLTIRLNFTPQGNWQNGDEYALNEKENKCVICNTEEDLTSHHIVPYCYRKFFPDEIKSHNSHDVVPICVKHHSEYEQNYAIKLKHYLATEYDAPIDVEFHDKADLRLVVKYAKLIHKKISTLPYRRKKDIISCIREYHGPYGRLNQIILLYSSVDLRQTKTESHGQIIVNKLIETNKIQEFVEMWRSNFIETMQPKYMPKYWDIYRPVEKTG